MRRKKNATNKGQAIPPVLYQYMSLERFLEHFNDYLDGKAYFVDSAGLNDPMEAIPLPDRFILFNNPYIRLPNETHDDYLQRIDEWQKRWKKLLDELEDIKICFFLDRNVK